MNKGNKVIYYYTEAGCNMNCGFCYSRENKSINNLNTLELKELILTAKSHGFNCFGFTGATPFNRTDLDEILPFLKSNNMMVRVDIHGLNDPLEYIEKYAKFIDWLGIPLDGHIASINDFNRSYNGHYDKVVSLIKAIKKTNISIKLKIHTVLTLRNLASVAMMPKIIEELSPDIWTIYKYFPAGKGYKNRDEFDITESMMMFIRGILPQKINNTIVDVPSDEIHDKAFLMSTSNGELYGCFDEIKKEYKTFGKFNRGGFSNALDYYGDGAIDILTTREFGLE